ncbi:MAG: DUF3341 domain-containing protein, partial [Candidatus Omnitrophica bacterium]|nr:DUF3341 domain-containing protein [Candidatus Omnitrophota bacterium]
VHTVVSYNFALAIAPGYHLTIFPPYFVAGAIYSGFAMVLLLIIPARRSFGLEELITPRHLDLLAKLTLATNFMVLYGYLMEVYGAWTAGGVETELFLYRMNGPTAPLFWSLVVTNVVVPQCLWFRRARSNPRALWWISLSVLIGMWIERFLIVVTGIAHDRMNALWGSYCPTGWEAAACLGSAGVFLFGMVMFVRRMPVFSAAEMRELEDGPVMSEASQPPASPAANLLLDANGAAALLEYDSAVRFTEALTLARALGLRVADAYAPYREARAEEAMRGCFPGFFGGVVFAGFLGAVLGLGMQAFATIKSYPMDIGGRPLWSWPAFVPVAFEMAILAAALTVFGSFLRHARLGRLHHRAFEAKAFGRSGFDRFFVEIEQPGKKLAPFAAQSGAVAAYAI